MCQNKSEVAKNIAKRDRDQAIKQEPDNESSINSDKDGRPLKRARVDDGALERICIDAEKRVIADKPREIRELLGRHMKSSTHHKRHIAEYEHAEEQRANYADFLNSIQEEVYREYNLLNHHKLVGQATETRELLDHRFAEAERKVILTEIEVRLSGENLERLKDELALMEARYGH